jgi:hypothetical protein
VRRYTLLIDNRERPEPGDPGFAGALAGVNASADGCRRPDELAVKPADRRLHVRRLHDLDVQETR